MPGRRKKDEQDAIEMNIELERRSAAFRSFSTVGRNAKYAGEERDRANLTRSRPAFVLARRCGAQSILAQAPRRVDDAALRRAPQFGDEWLTTGRDYAETHFSPLKQITSGNADRLGLAWTYNTDSLRGLEATPLIANGVLYGTTSWSAVFAVDARTGKLKWRWDPEVRRASGGRACCDVVNRGVALYQGKVFVGVLDGRLAALDAVTGKVAWQVQTTDPDQGYTITGAPRTVKGKVIIGNGGAEMGVRGYVSAYDAQTGKLV